MYLGEGILQLQVMLYYDRRRETLFHPIAIKCDHNIFKWEYKDKCVNLCAHLSLFLLRTLIASGLVLLKMLKSLNFLGTTVALVT